MMSDKEYDPGPEPEVYQERWFANSGLPIHDSTPRPVFDATPTPVDTEGADG